MPTSLVFKGSKLTSNFSVSDDTESLVKQARSGVEAAFSELYDRYFQKIYRFIYYRVGHKETAEDITEDVFVKAFQSLHGLKQDIVFEGWLYQIARNKVIDYYRSKKVSVSIDELENTLEYETNTIDALNLNFNQKILVQLLRDLTEEQQTVLRLKFFEELPNDEIALIMNKEEGAIRVIQHRAIAKLKILLDLHLKDE